MQVYACVTFSKQYLKDYKPIFESLNLPFLKRNKNLSKASKFYIMYIKIVN